MGPRGRGLVTPLDLVVRIGAILDDLDLDWVLGGSLASSLVGEPRTTLDIDMAVVLERRNVETLVAAVRADYYVSEPMVLEAVEHGSSFNLLHFETGFKVDVFVLTDDPLDRRQLAGRQRVDLEGATIWIGWDCPSESRCARGLPRAQRSMTDLAR